MGWRRRWVEISRIKAERGRDKGGAELGGGVQGSACRV
jgi:hypothetical protein